MTIRNSYPLPLISELLDRVKLEKCEFDVSETAFLGYILSKDGLKVDPTKIKAILYLLVPTTVKE
eukprot:jgi/Orpsp1_1/1176167/evm.model.c7180000056629.1